ncbi:MAG: RSP_7527 family protein [Marinomonas sp.]
MDTDYQYDAEGNIDTEYYIEQAYAMRRYYLTLAFKKFFSGIKNAVVSLAPVRPVHGHTAH